VAVCKKINCESISAQSGSRCRVPGLTMVFDSFVFVRRRAARGTGPPEPTIHRVARRPCHRIAAKGTAAPSVTGDRSDRSSRGASALALLEHVRQRPPLDRAWSMLAVRPNRLKSLDAEVLGEVQQRCLQLLQGVQCEMSQRIRVNPAVAGRAA